MLRCVTSDSGATGAAGAAGSSTTAADPAPLRQGISPTLVITGLIAAGAIGVTLWILVTSWPAIVHGHPLYAVLLGVTLLGGIVGLARALRRRRDPHGWRTVLWALGMLSAIGWLGMMIYLKPFPATEPSLAAMQSDAAVTVTETPAAIVMTPTGAAPTTGVLFQPGARVDARAYAGLMRPVAEQGELVVIPKQPLGVGLLATGALDTARAAHPEVTSWVVGGHSLGGTAAAMIANMPTPAGAAPVDGLLLYASYPAADISTTLGSKVQVLSVSGSNDGLATPADIEASRADLPASAQFVVIDGGVHAYFGDYGPQGGDGTATISREYAQAQIKAATLEFLAKLRAGSPVTAG